MKSSSLPRLTVNGFAPRRVPREYGADVGRDRMIRLLRAAFPGRSDPEIADRAALYLGVTDRTVRNWLAGSHEARLGDAIRLGWLVGWEAFLSIIEGGIEGGGDA